MNVTLAIFGGANSHIGPYFLLYAGAWVGTVALATVFAHFVRAWVIRLPVFGLLVVGTLIFGAALSEDYYIQRAEYFQSLMSNIPPGSAGVVSHSYIHCRISRATNGTVRCPFGTEQEVAQYLESKNQQWFSRSVIRVTEKLTSMTTPPATDQPAPRSD